MTLLTMFISTMINTMTKTIQDAQDKLKFFSDPITFSDETPDEITTPAEPTPSGSSGGSTGMLSLFALLGLGFLRRKTVK